MRHLLNIFLGVCGSLLLLGSVSCGGGSKPAPSPDYSISATPATLALTPGAAGQAINVSLLQANGFTGTVAVSIGGLPAGLTASPATFNLTAGATQKVTLAAIATAAAGNATLTLTGTSGALSRSATVAVAVSAPPPDFSLNLSSTSLALVAGGASGQVSVTVTSLNSYAGNVALAITGLPAGVTANPASLTLVPGVAQSITLTASASAVSGGSTVTFTGTSGSLIHSATVTVAVSAPAPDFGLYLSSSSLALVAGGAPGQISITVTPANSFTGTVAVAITGLPAGVTANPASLTPAPGVAQSIALTASAGTVAGGSTVTFTGTTGSLVHSAVATLTVAPAPRVQAPDVTTYHYDNARDGLNAAETILTLKNVNSAQFGKIGFDTVDGKVDAEPLYLANVNVAGTLRNVLYVATEHGSLYALDADAGTQLWKASTLASGEVPSDDHGCGQITPEIGITSTPVIDRKQGANGTLFTVGMSKDASGKYHQRLHALDATTGVEISGSPTEIAGSYPGTGANSLNGTVIFDPARYAVRAGLLLLNGNIYLGWTSHCDQQPYTGWIMAYSEMTLQQTQILNLTPNGSEGSIWMSSDGLAADSAGNIYFLDANGTFDTGFDAKGFPNKHDYGNAIVKLSTTGTLSVADFFEPYNTQAESTQDLDLGSGGTLLLPDLIDATGAVRHLLVGAGKDMHMYLGDRDNLGKFNSPDNSNLYQDVAGVLGGQVFSTPAYFNGVLYYGAVGDVLKAIPVANAKLASAPSSHSTTPFPYPGTTPGISANGIQDAIVWALESNLGSPGVLHAYDAGNLANELYNSNQAAAGRDSYGNGNKFLTPLIVNGKVYVGTQTGVAVFGLLTH